MIFLFVRDYTYIIIKSRKFNVKEITLNSDH